MIGTLVASAVISAILMAALITLAVKKILNDIRILPIILLSSGVCAISLFSLGVQLWPG